MRLRAEFFWRRNETSEITQKTLTQVPTIQGLLYVIDTFNKFTLHVRKLVWMLNGNQSCQSITSTGNSRDSITCTNNNNPVSDELLKFFKISLNYSAMLETYADMLAIYVSQISLLCHYVCIFT